MGRPTGGIHDRLIAVGQQRDLPVVSVYHHGPGRVLAPDDTEGAAAGPGPGRHAQAVGTPSALGEPETHPGVGQHGHRQVAPCVIRDAGVERTHQPAWVQRDLHGAGLLRPDPLARLPDHTIAQLISPAIVQLRDRQPADPVRTGVALVQPLAGLSDCITRGGFPTAQQPSAWSITFCGALVAQSHRDPVGKRPAGQEQVSYDLATTLAAATASRWLSAEPSLKA